jgi:UDP-glucose 4-epimerase
VNLLEGKTVVITGGKGFIGRHLLRRLVNERPRRLITVDRTDEGSASGEHFNADLNNITSKDWADRGVDNIDLVFHLASRTPKTKNDIMARQIYRDNIAATCNLLSSLPPTRRLLFASSIDVYGLTSDAIIDESTPLAPVNLYGASKVFGEEIVALWAEARGSKCSILRFGHIYGPGEEAYSKLIPYTIRTIRNGSAPVVQGDGGALRAYLFVADAVEAIIRIAENSASSVTGPINLTSEESVPIRHVVELLCSFANGIKPCYDSRAPNGPSFRFNTERLRSIAGVWPMIGLSEGLRREWDFNAAGIGR